MDADSIHLDHTPTMEASFTMTVTFTDMGPRKIITEMDPERTTSRTTATTPTMDNVVPLEIPINDPVYIGANCPIIPLPLTTLTLFHVTVVVCMETVLPSERVTGE